MKDYISIPEAAEKWGVSERLVNQYCIDGRVPGAERFGRSWAIPAGAEKPTRKTAGGCEPPVTEQRKNEPPETVRHLPMPLMNTPYVPGQCLAAVESVSEPNRRLAMAEYCYFSGRAEEAVKLAEPLLESTSMSLLLSACWICGYASFAVGNIDRAKAVLDRVRSTLEGQTEQIRPETRALSVFMAKATTVLLHLPLPETLPPIDQILQLLPPGMQMFALYVKGHHAYRQGDYSGSIGVVETALALQRPVHPIPTIYLHLLATMDYMSLRQPEKAREHLLAAWELARPDGLIEPFGEHHGLLGGMLEAVIKPNWPEDFKHIIAITYRFSAGWRKIHNPATGDSVADNLTTSEFAIAMLAARDWTNDEIAAHMGVSSSTVKRHISAALRKLNVTQRKELKQHMLQ